VSADATGGGGEFLAGRSALVTGASRGIGRRIALDLAGAGARVLPVSRGGAGLEDVARRCGEEALSADLTDDDGLRRLVGEVRDRLDGPPEILVNNAGVFALAPAHETPTPVLDRHLSLNLRAPILLTRAFLGGMRERDRGHLLHVGSVAGRRALPGNAAYSASKFGLRGFHEVLRVELRGTAVCSTLLEPGAVDTSAWDDLEERLGADLPPREAMLGPEEVARAAVDVLRMGPFGRGGSPESLSIEQGPSGDRAG